MASTGARAYITGSYAPGQGAAIHHYFMIDLWRVTSCVLLLLLLLLLGLSRQNCFKSYCWYSTTAYRHRRPGYVRR